MNASDRIADRLTTGTVNILRLAEGLQGIVLNDLEDLETELVLDLQAALAGKATEFTIARLNALLSQTRATIATAYGGIIADTQKQAEALVGIVAKGTVSAINAGIGASVTSVVLTKEQIESIARDKTIFGALPKQWWMAQDARLANDFARQMRMGQYRGETIDQLVARVRGTKAMNYTDGIMQASKAQAQALVRTGVMTVAGEANQAVYEANRDVIKGVQWVSTLDSRTTEICIALDGKQWHFPSAVESLLPGIIKAIQANGGITISLAGDQPGHGFAFAPSKDTETKIPIEELKAEAVEDYIKHWWDALRQPNAHFGAWVDGEGHAVFDVSVVRENELDALVRAETARQDAIFNLQSKEEIKTADGLKRYTADQIAAARAEAAKSAAASSPEGDEGAVHKAGHPSPDETGFASSLDYADYIPVGHDKQFSPPPAHWNCRSVVVPITFSWEELAAMHGNSKKAKIAQRVPVGMRASMNGQVAADVTFEQWLQNQPQAFQDEVLGPRRAKLWRNGQINLSQLTDIRNNPLTMAQLRAIAAPIPPEKLAEIAAEVAQAKAVKAAAAAARREAAKVAREEARLAAAKAQQLATAPPVGGAATRATMEAARESALTGPVTKKLPMATSSHVSVVAHLQMGDGSKAWFKPTPPVGKNTYRTSIKSETQAAREVAAYRIAKIIGMDDMVPVTTMRTYEGVAGSIQDNADGMEARKVSSSAKFDGETDASRAAAYDFFLGNTDRHANNWYIDESNNDKMTLIDHNLILPGDIGNMYNQQIFENAQWTGLTIPNEVTTWYSHWPEIETYLRQEGFTNYEIQGAGERLRELSDAAGKPFKSINYADHGPMPGRSSSW